MTAKTIHRLALHGTVAINKGEWHVMRVPGGWIYTKYRFITEMNRHDVVTEDWVSVSSTFVPLSEEFKS